MVVEASFRESTKDLLCTNFSLLLLLLHSSAGSENFHCFPPREEGKTYRAWKVTLKNFPLKILLMAQNWFQVPPTFMHDGVFNGFCFVEVTYFNYLKDWQISAPFKTRKKIYVLELFMKQKRFLSSTRNFQIILYWVYASQFFPSSPWWSIKVSKPK